MKKILNYLPLYGATTLILVAIDLAWLGYFAREMYTTKLSPVVGSHSMQLPFGFDFLVWGIMAAALLYFAVIPNRFSSCLNAARDGALLGGTIYSVYGLTNAIVVPNWPLNLVALDSVWGMVLFALVAAIAHSIARYTNQ